MATYGANYPCFKPNGETAGVVLGKLVSANMTIQLATGELYADDELAEKVSEFASGSIAMETDDLSDTNASKVYGATVRNGAVVYNKGDSAPMGKLAYYKSLMRGAVKFWKGFYYPKAQAALGNDNAQTKGSSITFQTAQTAFTIFPDDVGDWRENETFNTEAAAKAWCASKTDVGVFYEVDVQVQGVGVGKSVSPVGTQFVTAGGNLVITVEGYANVKAAYDNGANITVAVTGGGGIYTVAAAAENHSIAIVF